MAPYLKLERKDKMLTDNILDLSRPRVAAFNREIHHREPGPRIHKRKEGNNCSHRVLNQSNMPTKYIAFDLPMITNEWRDGGQGRRLIN